MKQCRIRKEIKGQRAVDGAGVHLVRVLGMNDVDAFDPFLMLDSFDSRNSADYIAGFPMHPHRGIETITYLIQGEVEHKDSLGNKGVIRSGEAQWMTSGSGILHEEMPRKSERMLGFQVWLNLPQPKKMTEPAYLSITGNDIGLLDTDDAKIRVLSGEFAGVTGITPRYIPVSIYDILIFEGKEIVIPVKPEETVFLFLIEGDCSIEGRRIPEKTAVLLDSGEGIALSAPPDTTSRIIFFSGKPLHEPISWGGPIVMNTQEELRLAFEELRQGSFIKHNPHS